MGKINREDMLELTRRMTLKRNCFDRIAGAYLDEEGFVDGTFNKHFKSCRQRIRRAILRSQRRCRLPGQTCCCGNTSSRRHRRGPEASGSSSWR